MSKGLFKIYVGNLDYKVTEFAVRRLFEPFGELEDVAMATDKQTGKPRGFAIVMMRDHDEARTAIGGVQGRRLMGRPLVVNEAVAKKNRKPEDGAAPAPAASAPPATRGSSRPQGDGYASAQGSVARTNRSSSRGSDGGEQRPSSRNPRRSGGRNPRRSSPR